MLHEPLDGPDKSVYMEHVMAHPSMEGANGDARALVVAYMCEVIVAMFRCVGAWVRRWVGALAWVGGRVGAWVRGWRVGMCWCVLVRQRRSSPYPPRSSPRSSLRSSPPLVLDLDLTLAVRRSANS